ncbi:hypothetical protein M427DRAFT_114969, partial [Gonapodya prolifera JEL478]
ALTRLLTSLDKRTTSLRTELESCETQGTFPSLETSASLGTLKRSLDEAAATARREIVLEKREAAQETVSRLVGEYRLILNLHDRLKAQEQQAK